MKLSDQVCSLEIAKRLKELGVTQNTLFYWCSPAPSHGRDDWEIRTSYDSHAKENYSAYTCSELGEMLPIEYLSLRLDGGQWKCVSSNPALDFTFQATEADARGKMLIYLLEQGIINASEV